MVRKRATNYTHTTCYSLFKTFKFDGNNLFQMPSFVRLREMYFSIEINRKNWKIYVYMCVTGFLFFAFIVRYEQRTY